MNNVVTYKGITIELQLNEPPRYVSGMGYVHSAKLVGSYNRDELQDLIGLQLFGDTVKAVESFAIECQFNRPIGLLLDNKRWGSNLKESK